MNVESVRIISRPVSSLQDSSDAPHPPPRTSVLGFPIPPLRGSASVGQARIAVPPIFQHRSAVCTIMNLAQANVGKFLACESSPHLAATDLARDQRRWPASQHGWLAPARGNLFRLELAGEDAHNHAVKLGAA